MKTREVDKIIASGKQVTLYNPKYDETITISIVKRDRYNLYSSEGGVYDRADLVLIID